MKQWKKQQTLLQPHQLRSQMLLLPLAAIRYAGQSAGQLRGIVACDSLAAALLTPPVGLRNAT
jgi:hypothetical protein